MGEDRQLPAAAYTEAAMYELERRDLFGRAWLVVGRAEEIPEVGAYFTWERTKVPFVMMRSVDKRVRALYNSCRHRGAPVVRTACGRARAFRCQYHSWTYDTFGKLVALPDERDFGEVDRQSYSLVPLQLAEVGGWLLVGQEAAAPPPDALGEAAAHLGRISEGLAFAERRVLTVESNWKAVVERLAELAGGNGAAAVTLFPNLLALREGGEARFLMAWPRDERMTDLEIVRCVPADQPIDAASQDWAASGNALAARLRDLADGVPASGARSAASREKASELATEITRRLGDAAIEDALASFIRADGHAL